MFKIQMGSKVKDKFSKFEGTITGRAEYIAGCRQYQVQAKGTSKNAGEVGWFDEERLIFIGMNKVYENLNVKKTGGPQMHPAPNR